MYDNRYLYLSFDFKKFEALSRAFSYFGKICKIDAQILISKKFEAFSGTFSFVGKI